MKNLIKSALAIVGGAMLIPQESTAEDHFHLKRGIANRQIETIVERALVRGMINSVNEVRNERARGLNDPFGYEFDYVFSSNITNCELVNFLHSVVNKTGLSFVSPQDQYNIGNIKVGQLWCHSQGCDSFINWANSGKIKADKVHIVGPPMFDYYCYPKKLEKAAVNAGASEVNIYQNRGNKFDRFSDIINWQNSQKSRAIPFPRVSGKVPINWYRFYTRSGEDRSYAVHGITHTEFFGLPETGHMLEDYYKNIYAVISRYSAERKCK